MPPENYELHERLDRLSNASADRDVLVTRTVSPDDSIGEARQPVETDYAEANQIDGGTAPKPLVEALEEIKSELTQYDEVPETGMALYAGVVDGDLVTATFDDLPVAIDDSRYEHGNEFDLEPLEAVTEPDSDYGLVVVERGGGARGRRAAGGVAPGGTFDSDVPGKSSAGGQSAERFERDRERQKREFFDEVAERAEREFLGDDPVDGLLLGGTTGTVETFREEADLDHRLEERIVGEFAVEYASEQGLRQLAEKGEDELESRDRRDVRETLSTFFDGIRDGGQPVAYGLDEVDDALEYDAVETLLLSTDLEGEQLQTLGDRAGEQGGDTVVVPDDFPDGSRFADAFDGVGALLRFPIE